MFEQVPTVEPFCAKELRWERQAAYCRVVVDSEEKYEVDLTDIAVHMHFHVLDLDHVIDDLNEKAQLTKSEYSPDWTSISSVDILSLFWAKRILSRKEFKQYVEPKANQYTLEVLTQLVVQLCCRL